MILVVGVIAAACGGGGSTVIEMDISASDIPARMDWKAEVAADVPEVAVELELIPVDATPDAETMAGCEPGTGCFLDPCQEHADCLFGPCLEYLGDKTCSQTCIEECPAGFLCEQLQGFEPDILFACISPHSLLCRPCLSSSDCTPIGGSDGLCIRYGGEGDFCGGDCTQNECPQGYSCLAATTVEGATVKQCMADAGVCDCSQTAVSLGLFTQCKMQNEAGTCAGKRVCTETGLTKCDAPTPASESCNGIDDDCDGDTDGGTCQDDNECTDDLCDPEAGCQYLPLDGSGCDDQDVCTLADHCDQGFCLGTPIDCGDDNPCTWDNCNPTGGCNYTYNAEACDDDDPCTVADQCANGQCLGFAMDCDCEDDGDCLVLEDGDVCNGTLVCSTEKVPHTCTVDPTTVINCPEAAGLGYECLAPDCHPLTGECSLIPASEEQACDDGDACTLLEKCAEGECQGGATANCNDGNLCTIDLCEPAAGCLHENNDLPCNDGDVCSLGDQCTAGVCAPGQPLLCDDGNPCTDDSCDPDAGCQHSANSVPCDDGNACTSEDQCQQGSCVSGPAPDCNDNDICTTDSCDPGAGCVHGSNILPCDDGNTCTAGDKCSAGACAGGSLVNCNDGNPCTDDGCEPGPGCVHTHNEDPCNDGDTCTTGDVCAQGACVGPGTLLCDDGNVCTKDTCDPLAGCQQTPSPGGCDDGNACTSPDLCGDGVCIAGPPVDCNDDELCTTDVCLWDSGCEHFPAGAGADAGICLECDGTGQTTTPAEDDECGSVSCDGWHQRKGMPGTMSSEYCHATMDMTPGLCIAPGQCAAPDSDACQGQPAGELLYSCDTCAYLPDQACLETSAGGCAFHPPGTATGLCAECDGQGGQQVPDDDQECGEIDCSELDYFFTQGEASGDGTNACLQRNYADLLTSRCEELAECKSPNSPSCTEFEDLVVVECGTCRYAEGPCQECSVYANDTACGPGLWCQDGECAQNPYGDGTDGNLAVAESGLVVNHYAHVLTEELKGGDQSLTVNDAASFATGDELLILQVQHESNAGVYEFAHVQEKNVNVLTLSAPLVNDYHSGQFNTAGAAATQVIRVPHFADVTVAGGASITAPAWDGYSGGVVVFRAAGTVSVDGSILVTGRGFRTGQVTCCKCNGYQGEGWAGSGVMSTAENSGGGGGSTWSNCGGDSSAGGSGGGGYGEAGQTGNDCNGCGCGSDQGGTGGAAYGAPALDHIFFGGGAGSNGRDNNCSVGNGAPGSPGGGIIRILSPSISVAGQIAADGGDNSASAGQDSSGPASGAGGTIHLSAETLSIGDNRIIAQTGAHGWTHWCCGAPVSGAVGRIRLDYESLDGTTSPAHYSE